MATSSDPRWHEPRISQLLPTVKCGDCGRAVEMSQLGAHRCNAAPPVPALPISPIRHASPPSEKAVVADPVRERADSVDSLMSFDGPSFEAEPVPYLTNGAAPRKEYRNDRETKDLANLKPSLNFLEKYNKLLVGDGDTAPPPVPSLPSPISTAFKSPASPATSARRDPPSQFSPRMSERSTDTDRPRPAPRPPASAKTVGHTRARSSLKITPPAEIRRALTPNPYAGSDRSFVDPRDPSPSVSSTYPASAARSPHPPINRSLTPTAQDMQRDYRAKERFDAPQRPAPPPRPTTPAGPSKMDFECLRTMPRPPSDHDRSRSPVPQQQQLRSKSRNKDRSNSPGPDPRSSEYQLIKQQPAWITQARPSLIPSRKDPQDWIEPSRAAPRPPPMPHNAAARAKEMGNVRPFTPPVVPTRNYTPPIHPARHMTPPVSSLSSRKQDIDALLSDLKHELTVAEQHPARSRSPASPTQRICAACDVKIVATDIALNAMGKSFHRACFRCRECRRALDQTTGYKQDESGLLLCDRDHQARYTTSASGNRICQGCNSVIVGRAVKALNTYWHDAHLLCAHCKKPLFRGHVEHRNRAYCQEDFATLFLPKCKGCRKPIEREALAALDGKWHPACFSCQICSQVFPDRSFYVFEGKPYCRHHYHKLNNSLCRRCKHPIEGICCQVIEGRFHSACFTCETCVMPLTDIYYNLDGLFYCESDVKRVQQRTNKRAEKRQTYFGQI